MIDDDGVFPIKPDGADDPELAARVAEHYRATPASTSTMAARCARYVLEQAALAAPGRSFGNKRGWIVGLAAVAAILLITVTLRTGRVPTATVADQTPVGSATPVDNGSAIQFELRLPKGAARVAVVGDFNGWDSSATPMAQQKGEGAWSAKVTLLPGRHVYAYIVNGKSWLIDPLAPQVSDNDFGPANALVVEGGTK